MPPDERERFEALFHAHHDAVLRYLLRRTDPETARDVLAETFLVAWRRRERLPAEPLPWLYGTARKALGNQRRAAGRREALLERLRSTVEPPRPDDDHRDGPLHEALARLSPIDREALMLDAWEGLSRTDAARVIGCRPATYGVRLHRARRRLRDALQAVDRPASTMPTDRPATDALEKDPA